MAIGKYILMPWSILSSPWFQALSPRQMVVFMAMWGLSRMDKRTPEGQLKCSLKTLGKEIGMSTSTTKRAVDELVDLEVVAIVAKGDGRTPAVYELAEPIGLKCARSVPGSGVDVEHYGALRSKDAREPGTHNRHEGGLERIQATCAPDSRVSAERYIHPPRGGVSQNSPSLGAEGLSFAPGPEQPRCEKCGSVLERTNTFMSASDYRIWRCNACFSTVAISDAKGRKPGQSARSTPRQGAASRLGGQDRAAGND